jgi:hypothetical protein
MVEVGNLNPWLTHYAAMQKNGGSDHQLFNECSTQASTWVIAAWTSSK